MLLVQSTLYQMGRWDRVGWWESVKLHEHGQCPSSIQPRESVLQLPQPLGLRNSQEVPSCSVGVPQPPGGQGALSRAAAGTQKLNY